MAASEQQQSGVLPKRGQYGPLPVLAEGQRRVLDEARRQT